MSEDEIVRIISPRVRQIITAMMSDPEREWTSRELADHTGVPIGSISSISYRLIDWAWITTRREAEARGAARPAVLLKVNSNKIQEILDDLNDPDLSPVNSAPVQYAAAAKARATTPPPPKKRNPLAPPEKKTAAPEPVKAAAPEADKPRWSRRVSPLIQPNQPPADRPAGVMTMSEIRETMPAATADLIARQMAAWKKEFRENQKNR